MLMTFNGYGHNVHNRYTTLREEFPLLDAFLHGFVSGASRKLGEKAGESILDFRLGIFDRGK
jgi:hypothetical protein